jgi:putative transposase
MQKSTPSPKLLSPWPIPRLPSWVKRVNKPLTEKELAAIRRSVKRGTPFGDTQWVEQTAKHLGLGSTLRPPKRKQAK